MDKHIKTTREFLKYVFTEQEIHEQGLELARVNQQVETLREEKKAVVSNYKAKIDRAETDMNVLSSNINNGYEYRNIECQVHLNTPNTGLKTVLRTDTGEIVRKEAMTPEELQYELQFESGTPAEE